MAGVKRTMECSRQTQQLTLIHPRGYKSSITFLLWSSSKWPKTTTQLSAFPNKSSVMDSSHKDRLNYDATHVR